MHVRAFRPRRRAAALTALLFTSMAAPASMAAAMEPPAPGAAPEAVPPAAAPRVIVGWVSTADDGAPEGLELRVRAGSYADVTPVGAAGDFAFEVPPEVVTDSLELIVDARDRAARRYHPALVRAHRSDLRDPQHVVLVPLDWTIAAGRYAGTRVEVSLERAYRPTCDGCSGFFRRGSALDARTGPATVPGWPGEHFPLRVAFDRARSDERITARDSAAFWKIVDEAHDVFGRTLFRPVAYPQTLPTDDHGPNDVILVWVVPTLRSPGRSTVGFHYSDIITANVWLRHTALITRPDGPVLVTHELLHALGFGHTCSWRSVLSDNPRCPRMRSPVPTPEDVAYVELAFAVNALTHGSTTRWGMEAAYAGERWSQLQLALEDAAAR